jgi:hypothetical protein
MKKNARILERERKEDEYFVSIEVHFYIYIKGVFILHKYTIHLYVFVEIFIHLLWYNVDINNVYMDFNTWYIIDYYTLYYNIYNTPPWMTISNRNPTLKYCLIKNLAKENPMGKNFS